MSQSHNNTIEYKLIEPPQELADFVESYWMLVNHADKAKEVIVLPDGRIDIFFSYSASEDFHVTLSGLSSKAEQTSIAPGTKIFALSFKLLAIEYILHLRISSLVNSVQYLPVDFWGVTRDDLNDFDQFCTKISACMKSLNIAAVDKRKHTLFNLIYTSQGAQAIQAMAKQVNWSSRQINRYFNQQFGISLKAYCNILRFRASFEHIKEGKLFPEQNFTDQAHFIRDVKKFSGVIPKELKKNRGDRFIQFSTLPGK